MTVSSAISFKSDDKAVLLDKRIRLLQLLDLYGSITKAAKEVPLSYKAAWDAIDAMNNLSPEPLVVAQTGGNGGGGSVLTDYGKEVIATYLVVEAKHKAFLESLNKTLGKGDKIEKNLETIKRISMQLSARNQLSGVVRDIKKGAVNTEITLTTKSNANIIAVITNESCETLGLTTGLTVVAIFKANAVLVSTDRGLKISARNQFHGTIVALDTGAVNSEIVIAIGDDRVIASITKEAVDELGLKVGDEAIAIIKASSIMLGV